MAFSRSRAASSSKRPSWRSWRASLAGSAGGSAAPSVPTETMRPSRTASVFMRRGRCRFAADGLSRFGHFGEGFLWQAGKRILRWSLPPVNLLLSWLEAVADAVDGEEVAGL